MQRYPGRGKKQHVKPDINKLFTRRSCSLTNFFFSLFKIKKDKLVRRKGGQGRFSIGRVACRVIIYLFHGWISSCTIFHLTELIRRAKLLHDILKCPMDKIIHRCTRICNMTKINIDSLGKNPIVWDRFEDEDTRMIMVVCDVSGVTVGEVRKQPNPHPDTVDRPWQAFRAFGPIRPTQDTMVRIKSGPPDNGSFRTEHEAKLALIRSLYFYWRTGEYQLMYPYVKPPRRRVKTTYTPKRTVDASYPSGDNQRVSRREFHDDYVYEAPPATLPPCPSCGVVGKGRIEPDFKRCTACPPLEAS